MLGVGEADLSTEDPLPKEEPQEATDPPSTASDPPATANDPPPATEQTAATPTGKPTPKKPASGLISSSAFGAPGSYRRGRLNRPCPDLPFLPFPWCLGKNQG